jgi:hypothetical protein
MTDEKELAFLDDEERDLIESFEAALDSGALRPSAPEACAKASAEWRAMVEEASARKANGALSEGRR